MTYLVLCGTLNVIQLINGVCLVFMHMFTLLLQLVQIYCDKYVYLCVCSCYLSHMDGQTSPNFLCSMWNYWY